MRAGTGVGVALAAIAAALVGACGGSRAPSASPGANPPESAAPPGSGPPDGGGVTPGATQPGFQFLPPLAPMEAHGTFQGGLSPIVTVKDGVTGELVASWTTSGGTFDARIVEGHDRYEVVWETSRSSVVAGRAYRIAVRLAGASVELGELDVTFAAAGAPRDPSLPFAPILGQALPIAFWIEAALAAPPVFCADPPACATWCVASDEPGGTWRPRAAPPFDPSTSTTPLYIGAAAIDGKLLSIATERLPLGGGNTFVKVATYDPALDAWSLPAGDGAFAGEASWGFAIAAVGHDLYRIAGFQNHAPGGRVSVYDTSSGTWNGAASPLVPSLVFPREFLAAATLDGRMYAAGGRVDAFPGAGAAVESYDPAFDPTGMYTWVREGALPEERWGLAVAAAGGKLYALGGSTTHELSVTGSLVEYDPGTKAWTPRTPMAGARALLGAALFAGRIHAVGGFGPDGVVSYGHEAYDPVADRWTTLAPMLPLAAVWPWYMGDGRVGVHAAAIGCHLYVISGGTLQEYTPPAP